MSGQPFYSLAFSNTYYMIQLVFKKKNLSFRQKRQTTIYTLIIEVTSFKAGLLLSFLTQLSKSICGQSPTLIFYIFICGRTELLVMVKVTRLKLCCPCTIQLILKI